MPVLRIDCDLRGGADRDLVARHIFLEVDEGERPATLCPCPIIDQCSRRLDLTRRDRIEDDSHLALEHASRHRVERDLGFVAGSDPLQ